MAKTTTLKLMSMAGSEEISTTISNANPDASDSALYTFAVALNDLTNNSYVDTERIDKSILAAPDDDSDD